MKGLAFILSIYIFILTTLPCDDVHQDLMSVHSELAQGSTSRHHDAGDLCSPFCTCNCCVTPVTIQVVSINFKCFSTPTLQETEYASAAPVSISQSIWQPPKIS